MKKFAVVCVILLFATTAFAAEKNLIELHKNSGNAKNKDCLACHADITKARTANKKIKTPRAILLRNFRNA